MVLGCGRSGTSIFGEFFDGLANYTYRSEPPFEEVMETDFSRPTAFKVPRESAAYPAPAGLSFPTLAYRAKAPEAAIFWIVRHPLDAICSLRIGIERNWGHHPRPPDWTAWLGRPLLERCAHHWNFLNTIGFDQVAEQAIVVKFEQMISKPVPFARSVCEHVGVNPAAVAHHLQVWAARVQDTNSAEFVEAWTSRNYSRPDHERRIGRWRENLGPDEAASLWPLVQAGASRFGYALED
jgi:hypothetical protein